MMESCDQDGNPYLGVFRGKEWLRNIKCYSPQDEAQEMPTECLNELRLLVNMAADLLAEAADRELKIIDEQLYLELFSTLPGGRRKKTAPREST